VSITVLKGLQFSFVYFLYIEGEYPFTDASEPTQKYVADFIFCFSAVTQIGSAP